MSTLLVLQRVSKCMPTARLRCKRWIWPLVSYFDKARLYEIISEFEQDGCMVFDNYVYTIEDGGMKEIDTNLIEFKRIADPHALMNPGKTRGWNHFFSD